jgi:hypothetical protein
VDESSAIIDVGVTLMKCARVGSRACGKLSHLTFARLQGVQFRCPKGQHNDLATAFFSTADGILGRMFSVGQDYAGHTLNNSPGFTQRSLLIYAAVYLVMMALTSCICLPAGLFMPSILLGASSGLLAGVFLHQVLPPHWHIQPGVLHLQLFCDNITTQVNLGLISRSLARILDTQSIQTNQFEGGHHANAWTHLG